MITGRRILDILTRYIDIDEADASVIYEKLLYAGATDSEIADKGLFRSINTHMRGFPYFCR